MLAPFKLFQVVKFQIVCCQAVLAEALYNWQGVADKAGAATGATCFSCLAIV